MKPAYQLKSVSGQIIIEIIQGKTFDYLFNAEFLPTKIKEELKIRSSAFTEKILRALKSNRLIPTILVTP
jgi:hypothetical protein